MLVYVKIGSVEGAFKNKFEVLIDAYMQREREKDIRGA